MGKVTIALKLPKRRVPKLTGSASTSYKLRRRYEPYFSHEIVPVISAALICNKQLIILAYATV